MKHKSSDLSAELIRYIVHRKEIQITFNSSTDKYKGLCLVYHGSPITDWPCHAQ